MNNIFKFFNVKYIHTLYNLTTRLTILYNKNIKKIKHKLKVF